MGNLGRRFPQGKPAASVSRYPTLINYEMHAGSFFVFPKSTKLWHGLRIFNVRTWLFLCVRVYTRGLGTPTASQHNIFYSEKLSPIFLVLLKQTGFEPRVLGSRVRRSTNRATPWPRSNKFSDSIVFLFCISLRPFVALFKYISRQFAHDFVLSKSKSGHIVCNLLSVDLFSWTQPVISVFDFCFLNSLVENSVSDLFHWTHRKKSLEKTIDSLTFR